MSKVIDISAALKLQELMEEISEENWCAGWLADLEYSLWRIMNEGAQRYGQCDVTAEQVEQLRALSRQSGGWIYFNDKYGVATFTSTELWQKKYDEKMDRVSLPLST